MERKLITTVLISKDDKYRYVLSRIFNESLPLIAFVGLNPSTADDEKDDPTIQRCLNYARDWGYGGFYMLNLFACRTPYKYELLKVPDPIGPENDSHIKSVIQKVDKVICCWGNLGSFKGRSMDFLIKLEKQAYCLNINASGEPSHPLYLRSDARPFIYDHHSIFISASKARLKKQFEEQLKEIGLELNIEVSKNSLIPQNWKNHSICFSYEEGGVLYGIKRNKWDKTKSRLPEIEKSFPEKFEASEWWPMYRPFYRNIHTELDFWTDIKEGKAKNKAKYFIEKIVNQFSINVY
jgi:hypothetical protein